MYICIKDTYTHIYIFKYICIILYISIYINICEFSHVSSGLDTFDCQHVMWGRAIRPSASAALPDIGSRARTSGAEEEIVALGGAICGLRVRTPSWSTTWFTSSFLVPIWNTG